MLRTRLVSRSHRTLLACGVAVALALADDPRALAATYPVPNAQSNPAQVLTVGNCDDNGPGSLRAAIDAAADGAIIDLSTLTCSTISLTTGALVTNQNELVLHGPGAAQLSIDAGGQSQILVHLGNGTLDVRNLSLANGHKYSTGSTPAKGGCLYSKGAVGLDGVTAKYCTVEAENGDALGGAVYAKSGVTIYRSTISKNSVHSNGGDALGGGVHTPLRMFARYTTLSQNTAFAAGSGSGSGGGARVGSFFLSASTISANRSGDISGIQAGDKYASHPDSSIINSTIANNVSTGHGSAVFLLSSAARIANSTLSGNSNLLDSGAAYPGAGVRFGHTAAAVLTLQSTIIAGNFSTDGVASSPSDLLAVGPSNSVLGADNLVGQAHPAAPALPADTIRSDDPHLGALAFNGGPTMTMLPLPGSAAIDSGNNVDSLALDQRGLGYSRVVGAAADIGAVEVNFDIIFRNGFD